MPRLAGFLSQEPTSVVHPLSSFSYLQPSKPPPSSLSLKRTAATVNLPRLIPTLPRTRAME